VAQRGAATGTEGQQPSSPRSTLRTVSLEDIGVVAPPDVSAPLLPPPPPPLSPVKVQTIPPEYDLTAADMFRLTLCMKLASKTDQIKYSPIKQRTSHNLFFVLHTTLRGDMIGPMLFEGTILLVSWFDKRGAETGEKKMGKSQYKAEEVIHNDNIKTLEDNRPALLSAESTPIHRKKAFLLHSRCILHDLLCVSSNERQSVCRLSVHSKMVPLRLPVLQRGICAPSLGRNSS
jgi:hypothetical protein